MSRPSLIVVLACGVIAAGCNPVAELAGAPKIVSVTITARYSCRRAVDGYHNDYHKASDTARRINLAGVERVVDIAEFIIRRTADR